MKVDVPGKIASVILKAQRGFAGYFGRKTLGLGDRGKMMFLAGVCILFGGLSLLSIVRVFVTEDNRAIVRPDRVAMPKHFDKTGESSIEKVVIVSPEFYQRLQVFKSYMDSLRQHSKPRYDSIIRARPGLTDSVLFLEQIYLQQK